MVEEEQSDTGGRPCLSSEEGETSMLHVNKLEIYRKVLKELEQDNEKKNERIGRVQEKYEKVKGLLARNGIQSDSITGILSTVGCSRGNYNHLVASEEAGRGGMAAGFRQRKRASMLNRQQNDMEDDLEIVLAENERLKNRLRSNNNNNAVAVSPTKTKISDDDGRKDEQQEGEWKELTEGRIEGVEELLRDVLLEFDAWKEEKAASKVVLASLEGEKENANLPRANQDDDLLNQDDDLRRPSLDRLSNLVVAAAAVDSFSQRMSELESRLERLSLTKTMGDKIENDLTTTIPSSSQIIISNNKKNMRLRQVLAVGICLVSSLISGGSLMLLLSTSPFSPNYENMSIGATETLIPIHRGNGNKNIYSVESPNKVVKISWTRCLPFRCHTTANFTQCAQVRTEIKEIVEQSKRGLEDLWRDPLVQNVLVKSDKRSMSIDARGRELSAFVSDRVLRIARNARANLRIAANSSEPLLDCSMHNLSLSLKQPLLISSMNLEFIITQEKSNAIESDKRIILHSPVMKLFATWQQLLQLANLREKRHDVTATLKKLVFLSSMILEKVEFESSTALGQCIQIAKKTTSSSNSDDSDDDVPYPKSSNAPLLGLGSGILAGAAGASIAWWITSVFSLSKTGTRISTLSGSARRNANFAAVGGFAGLALYAALPCIVVSFATSLKILSFEFDEQLEEEILEERQNLKDLLNATQTLYISFRAAELDGMRNPLGIY